MHGTSRTTRGTMPTVRRPTSNDRVRGLRSAFALGVMVAAGLVGPAAGACKVEDGDPAPPAGDAALEDGTARDSEACGPIVFRWVEIGPGQSWVAPVAEVVEDAAAFDRVWRERMPGYDGGGPTPEPPSVDFSTERVAWHAFRWSNQARSLEPEAQDCGRRIVLRPRFQDEGAEFPSVVVTLAVLPQSDAPVEFEDPVQVRSE